jgi:hypothetical protein
MKKQAVVFKFDVRTVDIGEYKQLEIPVFIRKAVLMKPFGILPVTLCNCLVNPG